VVVEDAVEPVGVETERVGQYRRGVTRKRPSRCRAGRRHDGPDARAAGDLVGVHHDGGSRSVPCEDPSA
jgi:hypothetical protein